MATDTSRWPVFARVLRRHALMDEMIEKQGVDLIAAIRAGDGFVQARARCRDCSHEGDCRDWFLEDAGAPAQFCPNLEFFRACKRGDG